MIFLGEKNNLHTAALKCSARFGFCVMVCVVVVCSGGGDHVVLGIKLGWLRASKMPVYLTYLSDPIWCTPLICPVLSLLTPYHFQFVWEGIFLLVLEIV